MTDHPMTTEVALLIGNLLAADRAVGLPGVGTLYTERIDARRISKRSFAPPCRVVTFSSQLRGVSLVDEIARTAQAPLAEAQEIYDRWLSRVQENEALTIEGVGVLRFKNFTLDAPFDKRLNPQGHQVQQLASRRGADWVLWVGVVAILAAVGLFGYQFVPDLLGLRLEEQLVVEVPQPAVVQDPIVDTLVVTQDSTMLAATAEVAATPPPTTSSASTDHPSSPVAAATASGTPIPSSAPPTAEAPARLVAGHNYVVLGVFSTVENASRAVRDASTKDANVQGGVYRFGEKFLVAAFESEQKQACTQFIQLKGDTFAGLWIYSAR